jgi:hypothetical protein
MMAVLSVTALADTQYFPIPGYGIGEKLTSHSPYMSNGQPNSLMIFSQWSSGACPSGQAEYLINSMSTGSLVWGIANEPTQYHCAAGLNAMSGSNIGTKVVGSTAVVSYIYGGGESRWQATIPSGMTCNFATPDDAFLTCTNQTTK